MTKEWESRVSMWISALKKRLYQPVGSMEFSYCTTYEHWSYETAMEAAYLPIQEGDFWGEEWEYGWFQSSFRLGEWAKGKRIVMDLNLGGEATLFVNGSVWGTRRADWVHEAHHHLCDNYLVKESQGDEEIYLVAECYAGHDLPPEAGEATAGPVGHAYQWNHPQKANRAQLGKCTYGIWNEDVYHLYLEVQVLHDIYKEADPNSLRVADLEEALQEFTMLVDFSLAEEDFLNCIKECRRFLNPYLSCVNGSTVPRMHAIGHAHIDLAWLWPMQETERKCARTMAAQIRHMEEYPEYKMLLSQPALYEMIKKHYPTLFTQLKEKAAEGQLIPEGGMWVESDTNIPSGESLIRQFLYGKKYFREEFGVESELLWLPDVFGYSAALPQIMNGCGIKYFATAKIFWTYNGGEPFPYHYFKWKGIDGSTTPSFIHVEYSSKTDAASLIKKWRGRRQREGLKRMLVATGYGDGGGGATRDHIENVRLLENCEGVPSITFDHPSNCFVQLDKECQHVPEYVGELYFQAHRGTYTSQAQIKKLNRFCELAMREAEIWNSLAYSTTVFAYPREDFEQNWKNILINQFHDILPGSAIHKVYEKAGHELEAVLAFSRMQTDEALDALIQEKEGQKALTIFNSLSWNRKIPVILPVDWNGAMTRDGKQLEGQQLENGICVEVLVPSIGTTTIYPASMMETNAAVAVDDKVMENEWLRLVLNDNGEIESLYDKETGMEWAAGKMNVFNLYQDIPSHYEAWDIDSMRKKITWEDQEPAQIIIKEQGPLFCEIKVTKRLHESVLTQWIRMERHSRTVSFRTRIDWQETQKLLKVAFPVRITTDELVSEIQFGHIKRPNHKSRVYDRDRFEVCNHKWSALVEQNRGFALLNDSKYGISCEGNQMELTLLKSAIFPDESADKGIQEFTYAFTLWNGSLASSHVVQQAYELNVKPLVYKGIRSDGSLITTDNTNIIIDCVKKSENSEDAIVIRAYECMGSRSRTRLHFGFSVLECFESNMVEEELERLSVSDGTVDLIFGAFEVKTLVLKVR